MVRIFDINIVGNVLSFRYHPESSNASGYVEMDTTDYKVLKYELAPFECPNPMFYVGLAKTKIQLLLMEGKPIPPSLMSAIY